MSVVVRLGGRGWIRPGAVGSGPVSYGGRGTIRYGRFRPGRVWYVEAVEFYSPVTARLGVAAMVTAGRD